MTFTEHLAELRTRIIYSGVAVAAGFLICYTCANYILDVLAWPLDPLTEHGIIQADPAPAPPGDAQPAEPAPAAAKGEKTRWTVLNPIEGFMVSLKIGGYGGLVLALPFVLYQLCAFIFPGLKPNERRAARIMLAGCSVLAIAGVGVAYFGVFPLVLPYMLQWTPAFVEVQLRLNETISLILKGLAAFAVAFQFPVVVLVLVHLELLSPETLKHYRRMAIVGLALLSGFLTPPDPLSMMIMLIPLLLLYEISIWASYLVVRRRRKAAGVSAG